MTNSVYTKSYREEIETFIHTWVRQHDTFEVEVLCQERTHPLFPKGMRNGWCLYLHVHKDNPLYEKVAISDKSDKIDYKCISALVLEHMHAGVTFKETEGEMIKIGCDFSHYMDHRYMNTPPSDENCLVHLFADSLESFVLEASGKEPSLRPEDWVRLVAMEWELRPLFASLLEGVHPFRDEIP